MVAHGHPAWLRVSRPPPALSWGHRWDLGWWHWWWPWWQQVTDPLQDAAFLQGNRPPSSFRCAQAVTSARDGYPEALRGWQRPARSCSISSAPPGAWGHRLPASPPHPEGAVPGPAVPGSWGGSRWRGTGHLGTSPCCWDWGRLRQHALSPGPQDRRVGAPSCTTSACEPGMSEAAAGFGSCFPSPFPCQRLRAGQAACRRFGGRSPAGRSPTREEESVMNNTPGLAKRDGNSWREFC